MRAVLASLAAAALLAAAAPSSASAHASFVESSPEPGARLEQSPNRLTLSFTEPLIPKLSRAVIVEAASGERIPAAVSFDRERRLILEPQERLDTAAYRVDWHTVSPVDGHALEGAFGFGVRTPAAGGVLTVEQSPLARDGWVRVALRGGFYAALFYFAGGLLLAALLGRPREPAAWLVPERVAGALRERGGEPREVAARAWRRTVDAGWIAAGLGVAVAVAEARDASGGLSPNGLASFLLSNAAGLSRVGAVLGIVAALALATRWRPAAIAALAEVFLAIALGGHAASADQPALAVVTDWAHLLGGAVWLGGIAQIAVAWLPALSRTPRDLRLGLVRGVLGAFGVVALPAFLLVAATGLTSALIQLGEPAALWETSYGRVLAAKSAVVAIIAVASYVHAIRIRPRLLAANPHPPWRLERRHWRLLGLEPLLGVAVVAAAALLAAFPLPPRQLGEAAAGEEGAATAACDPCPQPKPRAGELAVAEQAGSSLVAAWMRREDGRLTGELRVYGLNLKPVRADVEVVGARTSGCGPGCWRFSLRGRTRTLRVRVPEKGDVYTAALPARWVEGGSERARRLLERAEQTMRGVRSVREWERVASGPDSKVVTRYRLQAPDRFAYEVTSGAETVVIGDRQWLRTEDLPWELREFGAGLPFRTERWFRWSIYGRSVRLLDVGREDGRRAARLALFDEATPVWYRLTVDLATMRVLHTRMIADGHFMTQRFNGFNEPVSIEPPDGR